jgi:diaminopimelate decarboxylase
MKANPNMNILKIFNKKWILLDCSSEYEAYRAIAAGYNPEDLQISWQETPSKLADLLERWVKMVATSLNQIELIWKTKPGTYIWVRINPWMSSWAFTAISTWGLVSGFGIWHEYISQIKETAEKNNVKITKVHIHIWSENTPESWVNSANIGLDFVSEFPDVDTLDLWGWFKKAIMPYEVDADLQSIWKAVSKKFEEFYEKTSRKIHIEVEPWKAMVIHSCSVIAKVDDIVDTGWEGYKFIRTTTGMTEMPRVSMYGVQQPIHILNNAKTQSEYVVIWHCCESWDLLTPKLYHNESVEPVLLNDPQIGDTIIFEWTWAYNASMSMKNYNSFPEAGELLLKNNWEIVEIRKRQKLEDIWKNEIEVI